MHAINKSRMGHHDAGVVDLARIGTWYVQHNAVAEIYTPEGRPVSRRFYQAEVPFAWNAGLYVYAVHALGLAGQVS